MERCDSRRLQNNFYVKIIFKKNNYASLCLIFTLGRWQLNLSSYTTVRYNVEPVDIEASDHSHSLFWNNGCIIYTYSNPFCRFSFQELLYYLYTDQSPRVSPSNCLGVIELANRSISSSKGLSHGSREQNGQDLRIGRLKYGRRIVKKLSTRPLKFPDA